MRHGAEASSSASSLGVGPIVAAAARAGRRHRWRILAVAVAVCVITALVGILVEDFVDRANLPLSLLTERQRYPGDQWRRHRA
jgi:ABC-type Fe3+ transport system permease subunit